MTMYKNGQITPPGSPATAHDIDGKVPAVSAGVAVVEPPSKEHISDDLVICAGLNSAPRGDGERPSNDQNNITPSSRVPENPRLYQGSYKLQGQYKLLGEGAWSTVYSAVHTPAASVSIGGMLPMTPPSTPEKCTASTLDRIVAVKRLARRDGKNVLEKEACILTYLHSYPDCTSYLVPFYGYEPSPCAIIMDCVPLTLDDHASKAAQAPFTIAAMGKPVIGLKSWISMTVGLMGALVFLHDHGCVHGDIKPSNILLRQTFVNVGEERLEPLFCDFSSSEVVLEDNAASERDEVSAVTVDYASPELLQALKPYHGQGMRERAIATFASDVFALGVTLVFAIIGQSPYAQARLAIQKNAMALEGKPLQFAQDGDQGFRITGDGICHGILEGGLRRDPRTRWTARDWEQQTRHIISDWSEMAS